MAFSVNTHTKFQWISREHSDMKQADGQAGPFHYAFMLSTLCNERV
jgi:hypothetical protein